MPWFSPRRQSIGSRIFIGYGVLMALALGFMVIIVSLLLPANTRQIEALNQRQRLETAAFNLVLALQKESDAVNGYLLGGDERYLGPYRDGVLQHQAALEALQQLVLTADDQAELQRVRDLYLAFLTVANDKIDRYREVNKQQSVDAWQVQGRQSKEALEQAIDEFVRTQRGSIDATVAEAEDRRQLTTLLMMGLMVVAGISVILSGRRLTRSITRPVDQLVEVASAFSEGQLERRARVETRDELATLARVMNGMAANLAHSRAAVQASLRQTEERNRQLATLNSLAAALSRSLDLRVILERALDHVLSLSGTERGWVWLLEGDRLAEAPLVARHMTAAEVSEVRQTAKRDYLRAVARQGEVISKEQPSPLAHGTPAEGPTGRSLLVPLATRDRAFGVMGLSGSDPRQVEAASLELLLATGRQIAVGIENARLFAAEERLKKEALGLADTARLVSGALELGEILPIIAESGVSLLNVDRCVIFLFEASRHGGPGIYHYGLSLEAMRLLAEHSREIEAVARRHVATAPVLSIPEVAAEERRDPREIFASMGARSALTVALQARGRPLGVLYFDTVARPREFSTQDQRVAEALADQAAVGIEGALLYAGVQERAGQLAGLYEIGKVIAATLDQEELCEVLYRETRRLMDADAFMVSLYSAAEEIQRLIYRVDRGRRAPAETLPASAGLTGHVIRTRQPLLISRAELEGLGVQAPRAGAQERPTRSLLCAPLTREGRVLGVISTQSYRADAYTRQHLELFEAIANQAAIAIENGQLQRRALDLAIVEERNRLARELHDSVTQMLFSITLTLQAGRVLLKRSPAQAEQQVDKAQQTAQEALAEMRALIHQLRPASMGERGLVAALTSYLDVFQQRTGLEVTFQPEGEMVFSEAQEQALFRIVQEALNNIVKHAQASHVEVHLVVEATGITLTVRDDGRGLSAEPRANTGPTWGVVGMRERAEVLGGAFAIEPADGGGTRVRVWLPVAVDHLVMANDAKEVTAWSQ